MKQKNPDLRQALKTIAEQQEQLLKQEKLASLGMLMAGIAHEIKNPLNFIKNFAELSQDLNAELATLLRSAEDLPPQQREKIDTVLNTLQANLSKISEHSVRADEIIQTMLEHSKGKPGQFKRVSLNTLLDEYIHLAYQAMRLKLSGFHVMIEKEYDQEIGDIDAIPHELGRVFINLVNNACDAMNTKRAHLGKEYSALLTVITLNHAREVEIVFRDNGIGIQRGLRDEIFKPFFSTKAQDNGTGLGLSLCYDIIVREHGGEITFDSEEEMFTEFRIRLPKKQPAGGG